MYWTLSSHYSPQSTSHSLDQYCLHSLLNSIVAVDDIVEDDGVGDDGDDDGGGGDSL